MYRTLKRILVTGCAALILGFLVNQAHPRGIGWRLLLLSVDAQSRREAWNPISADSAFVHFMMRTAVFIDIRTGEEFELDHIPGARSVPFRDFFRHPVIGQERETVLVLYAFEPMSTRPRLVAQQLLKMGHPDVMFLRNGFSEWLERGFPTERGRQ